MSEHLELVSRLDQGPRTQLGAKEGYSRAAVLEIWVCARSCAALTGRQRLQPSALIRSGAPDVNASHELLNHHS